ncbi:extracellular solute-binding protein [uncultured Litoreibacter sp.]|uniref:extracellular solute-binding protein n=1 Tax=uncultured Litoreibacter sp. TaxID=1392394 RepID=UPI0026095B2A|nr:extracellular solute-binding protein [uncultured Litoreibacter sp.]
MTRRPAKAVAVSNVSPIPALFRWSGIAILSAAAIGFAGQVKAEDGVTVSHGYSSFGELKYGPDIKHLDYVNPDAPKGGEMSTWALGTFDSFNQYARDGNPAALNTIGSERILTSTADDPYGMYCYLCETLEYDDALTYVQFNLRKDVKFWDGTGLTAHDLKFTNELFRTKGIPEYRRIVENFFEDVEVIDDYTIKFTFNPESPKRDRVSIAGITPSFSKKWFEDTGAQLDKATDAPFMSTGPYKLDTFDYNRQVIYRRDENFWGKDHPFSIGHYNFDTIRTEYFADRTAAFEAFKTGAYLFKAETDPKEWATGYGFENVKNGSVKLDTPVDGTVGQALSFVFNLDREPWQDARVREAVGLAFNFEWSNKALFYDLFERPDSFWPNTDLAATGVPSEGELAILKPLVDEGLLPESILTDEVTTQVEQDADKNRPSRRVLRQASTLLDEAGWEFGNGQFREKDGKVLTLNIIQFNPLYDRVVNPFIENLKALGIDADLERIDRAQYIERRRAGDFDMTNQGFQMPFEPSLGMEQWFSSKTADNSSRNLMRLRDPAVDKIIPAIINADTLDGLKTAVHALDRVLLSLRFAIPQWYKKENWLAYYDVYRRPAELPPLSVGVYDFWWYDQEAADKLKASGVLR